MSIEIKYSQGIQILSIVLLISSIWSVIYLRSVKYYLKFAAVYISLCLSTVYLSFICLFRPGKKDNVEQAFTTVRKFSKLIGIHWVITKGEEYLNNPNPAVVVCNHQSVLDLYSICELWPLLRECTIVSKKSLLYVFPIGIVFWITGATFIDRGNQTDSRNQLNNAAADVTKTKKKMFIYPEGTRNKRPDIQPFKKGAFKVAIDNNLPIIPVVVSPYSFINDDKKIFGDGKMYITILPPVTTNNKDNVDELTNHVHELMNNEYHRLENVLKRETK